MKLFILPVALLCISVGTFSQTKLISNRTLAKMMTDYYNFTIAGSQTPTSGFKVETVKPSITLKGNVFSNRRRWFIANLELEGGVDNGAMQLFSGKELSTYFKGNLGFNILMPNYKSTRYVITTTEAEMTKRAFYTNKVQISRQLDSFAIIKTMLDDPQFYVTDFCNLINSVLAERGLDEYEINNFSPIGISSGGCADTIRKILIGYGAKARIGDTHDDILNNFRTQISDLQDDKIATKKLLQDYDRLKELLFKNETTLSDKQSDFELDLTKVLWTWRSIQWVNVSIAGSNSNFKLFDPTSLKLTDSGSFLKGITISYNWLKKGFQSHRFFFLRGGVTFQQTNSLTDLTKFTYKKETTIAVSPTEQIKDSKEGIAYKGELIEKNGIDIFCEFYGMPLKSQLLPGLYLKTIYRNSNAWINPNKIGLDAGLIWNVTNSDKDSKNILSIVPYVSWSNFKTEYIDVGRTEQKKKSDLFSFNIKFGIPVNLGK